jgi:hypothetical protein
MERRTEVFFEIGGSHGLDGTQLDLDSDSLNR